MRIMLILIKTFQNLSKFFFLYFTWIISFRTLTIETGLPALLSLVCVEVWKQLCCICVLYFTSEVCALTLLDM